MWRVNRGQRKCLMRFRHELSGLNLCLFCSSPGGLDFVGSGRARPNEIGVLLNAHAWAIKSIFGCWLLALIINAIQSYRIQDKIVVLCAVVTKRLAINEVGN